ncbi:ORF6N domain-containing protein [Enterocloster clostridioformis]|nr:ORF6N domain-containing protein [uncultured Anaerostipes sp.]
MNEIKVTGKQEFMGLDIPVVLGGFGEGKKCISDKTIAEIHGVKVFHARELIGNNIKRFTEGVDYIDMKKRIGTDDTLCDERMHETQTLELLLSLGYAKQSITQAEHIYILSERGYAKLIKIMDTDLAWEVHDKLMNEYFELRDEKVKMDNLSPELRLLINMEMEQKRQAAVLAEVKEANQKNADRIESIRDVVSLDTTSWRDDTRNLINKMAQELGGGTAFQQVRAESYELLEKRMSVSLKTRLTNKRRRMADEGVCKSKRDKLSMVDIISEDKKLIEGYTAIVKEMAIKYGVA